MEVSLIILCIILGAAALFSIIHSLLLKRQIRDIIRQNHFIQNEDTNLPITAAMPDKEVEALIESINTLLETHRQFEIRMTQANRSFKNRHFTRPAYPAHFCLRLYPDAPGF